MRTLILALAILTTTSANAELHFVANYDDGRRLYVETDSIVVRNDGVGARFYVFDKANNPTGYVNGVVTRADCRAGRGTLSLGNSKQENRVPFIRRNPPGNAYNGIGTVLCLAYD